MDAEADIPADVQSLIVRHIDSVVQLEMLLLLHGQPQRIWSPHDIARELRIESGWTATQIDRLATRRLLTIVEEPTRGYRYGPGSTDLAQTIDRLAQVYADRRVRVIALIYSKPADSLRTFADAFRFRKEDNDG